MAVQLIDCRVVAGRIIPVCNLGRKPTASTTYYAVWVEDADGKDERCLLFTNKELDRAEKRASKNKEDIPAKSLLTNMLD